MQHYIGIKHVKAKPMTRGEYNSYRGWTIPSDENPNEEGFLVEYMDSPNSNRPNHENYISWCPNDVFVRANKAILNHDADIVLEALQETLVSYT